MSTYKQIRFSVENDAIDTVKKFIKNYADYVGNYAKQHNEEWTWSTFQSTNEPTEFVSVISHENANAETRHMEADGTREFAKNLYAHVTDNEQIDYQLIASSEPN